MWPHLKLVVRRLPSMQTIGVGADIPVSGEGFRSIQFLLATWTPAFCKGCVYLHGGSGVSDLLTYL